MAYAKTTWADGDVITQAKLQNIENGIAAVDTASTGALKAIPDNAVTTAKIANGAVTAAKIAAGVIPAAYSLPAAGTALGGVKNGAAVAAFSAANAAAAAATAPTKAEFDAVVTEANATKAQLNALIASLKASGAIG